MFPRMFIGQIYVRYLYICIAMVSIWDTNIQFLQGVGPRRAGELEKELNIKTFDDIDRHWGKQQIELLASKNMIAGKGNNMFDPDGQVTRAEFITMVVRKLNLPLSFNKVFNDADYNDWYFGYVNSGAQHNLLPPTFVGNIEGNKPITREEMAYIVMRTYDFRLDNKKVYPSAIFYKDSNEVSSWAKDNISRATQLKIIQGWNNNFMPKNNATRAESATMLYNLFRAEGIFTE